MTVNTLDQGALGQSSDAGRAKTFHWRTLASNDVICGIAFIALALFGLWESHDYPMGTALAMGPGYLPRLLCLVLLALGVIIIIADLRSDPSAQPSESVLAEYKVPLTWSSLVPVVAVSLSVFTFGQLIERSGFVLAMLATVLIGGFASRESRPLSVILTAVILTLFNWVVFVVALGVPLRPW